MYAHKIVMFLVAFLVSFCELSSVKQNKNSEIDPEKLAMLEKSLLSIFGLKQRPQIDKSKVIIPNELKKLYTEMQNIDNYHRNTVNRFGLRDTPLANTIRTFTIEGAPPKRHIKENRQKFRLNFNISNIPDSEKLKASELSLKHEMLNIIDKNRCHFLVYDIIRPGIKNKYEPILILIDSKSFQFKNSKDTVKLDVQPAVNRWRQEPRKNHGLLIEVIAVQSPAKTKNSMHNRQRRSFHEIDETLEGWMEKQPVLFTYTDDERYRPHRSSAGSQEEKRVQARRRTLLHRRRKTETSCRRKSLYVDFSTVGWSDWIVAPQGYDAFFCEGHCSFPLPDHLNATSHAVIQTLIHSIRPDKVPQACCIPTDLGSITILYLDEQGKVILKNYKDMVVIGCGCR